MCLVNYGVDVQHTVKAVANNYGHGKIRKGIKMPIIMIEDVTPDLKWIEETEPLSYKEAEAAGVDINGTDEDSAKWVEEFFKQHPMVLVRTKTIIDIENIVEVKPIDTEGVDGTGFPVPEDLKTLVFYKSISEDGNVSLKIAHISDTVEEFNSKIEEAKGGSTEGKILHEILKEQKAAAVHWNGTKEKEAFDDKNTLNDWAAYIVDYASSAAHWGKSKEESRVLLVKAGGLVLSALLALERNGKWANRHYDKEV